MSPWYYIHLATARWIFHTGGLHQEVHLYMQYYSQYSRVIERVHELIVEITKESLVLEGELSTPHPRQP